MATHSAVRLNDDSLTVCFFSPAKLSKLSINVRILWPNGDVSAKLIGSEQRRFQSAGFALTCEQATLTH